ncbi:hypothetical protein QUB29_09280 [Microcoleus sp. B4b_D2]
MASYYNFNTSKATCLQIELRLIIQQVLAFQAQFKRFAIARVLDLTQGIVAV